MLHRCHRCTDRLVVGGYDLGVLLENLMQPFAFILAVLYLFVYQVDASAERTHVLVATQI